MTLKSTKPDFTPGTTISSSEVEGVFSDIIDDLQSHEDKLGTGASGHTHDGVDSRKINSANVIFDNTGTDLSSTNVQDAIAEQNSDFTSHASDASAHHVKTTSVTELTDHTKAVHDALNIDADTVDGYDALKIPVPFGDEVATQETTEQLIYDEHTSDVYGVSYICRAKSSSSFKIIFDELDNITKIDMATKETYVDTAVTNKNNAYDNDLSTSASVNNYSGDCIKWDLGSDASRYLYVKLGSNHTGSGSTYSRFYYSSDGSTWNLYLEVVADEYNPSRVSSKGQFITFRYLKWMSSMPGATTALLHEVSVVEEAQFDDTTDYAQKIDHDGTSKDIVCFTDNTTKSLRIYKVF